jgi:cyclopropane fatty-acyl-phospholipid synthase-like methyltransferase
MLQFASQHVQNIPGHESTFEFILSDIDQFESDEKFDVVVAMGFFDYVTDTLGTLKRLREFCDHSVIASFPSRSYWRTPIRKARYWLKKCPVLFFKSSQILDLSDRAGFVSCDLTKIEGAGMDYVAIFKK